MAKKPKKSKAQASPQELMEKRIGASMSARGDKILDTTIAGLKDRLASDQTQYYSNIAAADEAQSRANTGGLGTLQGDFTQFSNNVRNIYDAKRRARGAGLDEQFKIRKAITDVGAKKNTASLSGLSTLSRLAAGNTMRDMANKQTLYGANMAAAGTIAGAGFEKGFDLGGGIFGGSSSTGEENG